MNDNANGNGNGQQVEPVGADDSSAALRVVGPRRGSRRSAGRAAVRDDASRVDTVEFCVQRTREYLRQRSRGASRDDASRGGAPRGDVRRVDMRPYIRVPEPVAAMRLLDLLWSAQALGPDQCVDIARACEFVGCTSDDIFRVAESLTLRRWAVLIVRGDFGETLGVCLADSAALLAEVERLNARTRRIEERAAPLRALAARIADEERRDREFAEQALNRIRDGAV